MGRRVFILVCLLTLVLSGQAFAEPQINRNGTPYAIGGYDVVAYFLDKRPTRGAKEHAVSYRGATWLFASAEHKQRFERSPERFAPAYLGYCAYGVSRNYLVKIDPDAWTVLDGKLYLNYSLDVRETWLKDPPRYVAQANRNWPGLTQ